MATDDRRNEDARFPVARYEFPTETLPAIGVTAQTETLGNINGTIEALEIVIADTTDGVTFTVTITSATGATLFSEASLADNQTHYKVALSNKATQDADFNPIPVNSTLTVTVTPNASPDAAGNNTVDVQVIIYVR
ncbi:hypothetical protein LCGC14_0944500 [marine sediment metagenome]|uniref:Uncharacterized protein n=1 Tax=marine sediment metagenome TaxID=412755 RepID=A0A0F9NNT6_9ZZZZ